WATALSTAAFALTVLAIRVPPYPRSVFLMEPVLAILLMAGRRLPGRAPAPTARTIEGGGAGRLRVAGGGAAGGRPARAGCRNMPSVTPVGFLDDDPHKTGMTVHGVPVLGTIEKARAVVADHRVGEVVIAIPTATGREMRRIIEQVSAPGVTVRTLPGLDHLI